MSTTINLGTPGQPGPMNAGDFTPAAYPNLVSFAFEEIPPPTGLYIQRDDVLVIQAQTTNGIGDNITITARILSPAYTGASQPGSPKGDAISQAGRVGPGTIQTIQFVVNVPNNSAAVTSVQQLMEGYLLSVSAQGSITNTTDATHVVCWLGRTASTGGLPASAYSLFSDYTNQTFPIGWPFYTSRHMVVSRGQPTSVTLAAQPAGSGVSFTFTNYKRASIRAIQTNLTTSATVANREVYFFAQDNNGNQAVRVMSGFIQVASGQLFYSAGVGTGYQNDTTVKSFATVNWPIPDFDITTSWVYGINADNLQATDVFGATTVFLNQAAL